MEELLTIVKGCADNDSKSQRMFYEHYLGYALKIAFRYVNSYQNATDAANDAFIRIFKAIARFEIHNAADLEPMLMGWMRKIIIHVAIDYMKKESLMGDHSALDENKWLQADTAYDGDRQLMYKDLISLIRKLSPAYRIVFNLHVIDGYTHQEIAQMLGISAGTSKSNLSKAKTFLQKYLIKDRKGNILCFT